MNGYLVGDNEILSFVDRIDKLLAKPEDLAQYGANARSAALHYTVDQSVGRWNDVLDYITVDLEPDQSV